MVRATGLKLLCVSFVATLFCSLVARDLAWATVECGYTGTGCNAGYSAVATFECTSASQLKLRIANTSGNDATDPRNNVLIALSFDGASPIPSAENRAMVSPDSVRLPVGLPDCGRVVMEGTCHASGAQARTSA